MRWTNVLCSQYFKRYIERELHKGKLRRQWHPLTGWKEQKKQNFYPNEYRPWTYQYKAVNPLQKKITKTYYVEPIKEWNIFFGDRVEILVGPDKGKQGIVNCVMKERNWVWVEGLNNEYKMMEHHHGVPPTCLREEQPLLVTTQVRLVDPATEKGTSFVWRYTEEGKRVRISTETGRVLPLPDGAYMGDDLVVPARYVECDKDTKEKLLKKATFKPKMCTFEEEIMKEYNIVDDRKPAKTYWY